MLTRGGRRTAVPDLSPLGSPSRGPLHGLLSLKVQEPPLRELVRLSPHPQSGLRDVRPEDSQVLPDQSTCCFAQAFTVSGAVPAGKRYSSPTWRVEVGAPKELGRLQRPRRTSRVPDHMKAPVTDPSDLLLLTRDGGRVHVGCDAPSRLESARRDLRRTPGRPVGLAPIGG